jgi:hypothetical protein
MTWDGIERRGEHRDGHDGRREGDWHCPDHATIQENTKEHRNIVCGKIRTIKEDAEKDLTALRAYHDQDVEDLKMGINGDLRGMMRFVSVLMTIAILVIGGQALWLRSDISDVGAKIQRLNQRVSEGVEDRVKTDMEQTRKLGDISGKLDTMSWRLTVLEDSQRKAVGK